MVYGNVNAINPLLSHSQSVRLLP